MDILSKAKILGDAGRYDSCGPKRCEVKVENGLSGLYQKTSKDPNCVMLKTLMTNACTFDCRYCSNSTSCKNSESSQKTTITADELSRIFFHAKKTAGASSLFLSSGVVKDPDHSMQNMIDAIRKVRAKGFRGYIHLKVIPGASYEMIKQAAELSNRLSINIESPSKSVLSEYSTNKDFSTDILKRQAWIKNIARKENVTQSTQMIVTEDTTDKDIIRMTSWQYNNMKTARVYYSAFKPVIGTEMSNKKEISKKREAILYNVDFLMREYGYNRDEFYSILNDESNLIMKDPKMLIAQKNFEKPLDISAISSLRSGSGNESSKSDIDIISKLMRVPGIGPQGAKKMYEAIKRNELNELEDLKKLGIRHNIASPFLSIGNKRQSTLGDFGSKE